MKNKFIVVAALGGPGLLHFPHTAAAQPAATTLAAASITETNATFNGTANPNGAAAVLGRSNELIPNRVWNCTFIGTPSARSKCEPADLEIGEPKPGRPSGALQK
jgi:hypothetical protein